MKKLLVLCCVTFSAQLFSMESEENKAILKQNFQTIAQSYETYVAITTKEIINNSEMPEEEKAACQESTNHVIRLSEQYKQEADNPRLETLLMSAKKELFAFSTLCEISKRHNKNGLLSQDGYNSIRLAFADAAMIFGKVMQAKSDAKKELASEEEIECKTQ